MINDFFNPDITVRNQLINTEFRVGSRDQIMNKGNILDPISLFEMLQALEVVFDRPVGTERDNACAMPERHIP